MNRKDRRGAAKQDKERVAKISGSPVDVSAPIVAKPERAGFMLRAMSRILLSQWVLKRVHHPAALFALSQIAQQTGRMDVLMQLNNKLNAGQQ